MARFVRSAMRAPRALVVVLSVAALVLGLLILTMKNAVCMECVPLELSAAAHKAGVLASDSASATAEAAEAPAGSLQQEPRASAGVLPNLNPTPRRVLYEKMQAAPNSLVGVNTTQLLLEFEAAPWLLPPRSALLPWMGVHGIDELMAMRAQPVGKYRKGIALLLFNKAYAIMAQNSIYSLVKMGGVRNFVVLTWTPADLEACADLNLPCANVEHMLVEPLAGTEEAQGAHLKWGNHDWLDVVWLKPALVRHALEQGYVVMLADTDIAYTVKPVWDSYLAFIEEAGADGAFQNEIPVNTGQFVMLPTPASIFFAQQWHAVAPFMLHQGLMTQKALTAMHRKNFFACNTLCQCYRGHHKLTEFGVRGSVPVFRTFQAAHVHYTQMLCTIGNPEWYPEIDHCDYKVMFWHPICMGGVASKTRAMQAAGFWFMDDEQGCAPQKGSASQVPACLPLQWRLPQTEAPHYSCPAYGLALVKGQPPPAVAALARDGILSSTAERLLETEDPLTKPDWC